MQPVLKALGIVGLQQLYLVSTPLARSVLWDLNSPHTPTHSLHHITSKCCHTLERSPGWWVVARNAGDLLGFPTSNTDRPPFGSFLPLQHTFPRPWSRRGNLLLPLNSAFSRSAHSLGPLYLPTVGKVSDLDLPTALGKSTNIPCEYTCPDSPFLGSGIISNWGHRLVRTDGQLSSHSQRWQIFLVQFHQPFPLLQDLSSTPLEGLHSHHWMRA